MATGIKHDCMDGEPILVVGSLRSDPQLSEGDLNGATVQCPALIPRSSPRPQAQSDTYVQLSLDKVSAQPPDTSTTRKTSTIQQLKAARGLWGFAALAGACIAGAVLIILLPKIALGIIILAAVVLIFLALVALVKAYKNAKELSASMDDDKISLNMAIVLGVASFLLIFPGIIGCVLASSEIYEEQKRLMEQGPRASTQKAQDIPSVQTQIEDPSGFVGYPHLTPQQLVDILSDD